MGLLNKWLKKKEQDQLEAAQNGEVTVKTAPKKKETTKKKSETSKTVSKVEPEKKTDKVEKESASAEIGSAHLQQVLVRSLVSEKAAGFEHQGIYSFVVAPSANKIEIKKAVKQFYGVTPKKVRIINVEGKKVNFGRRQGRRSDWKKAIVYLPKGQSINIHEGV